MAFRLSTNPKLSAGRTKAPRVHGMDLKSLYPRVRLGIKKFNLSLPDAKKVKFKFNKNGF